MFSCTHTSNDTARRSSDARMWGRNASQGRRRARRRSAAPQKRSPVMRLEAVPRAGSVARVSEVNGAQDTRTARQRDILETLQQARQVDVTELAERFGVSGMTIRRDLAELDEAGQLQRVHGGAIIRRAPAYGSRAAARGSEKAAIARAVAPLVDPGAAIGIDTGTTCHGVAAELARRSDLTVVTNA